MKPDREQSLVALHVVQKHLYQIRRVTHHAGKRRGPRLPKALRKVIVKDRRFIRHNLIRVEG